MRINIVFPLCLVCILAAIALVHSAYNPEAEWAKFKKDYNRHYSSPQEERCRKEIFLKSLARIEHQNTLYDKGASTYKESINEFADETGEEFRKRHLGLLENIKGHH